MLYVFQVPLSILLVVNLIKVKFILISIHLHTRHAHKIFQLCLAIASQMLIFRNKIKTIFSIISAIFLCSGRLIRTFADVKYGNYHLTTVEIIYNIISLIVAVITTVAFTVYAKNALNELQREEETSGVEASTSGHGSLEMEKASR